MHLTEIVINSVIGLGAALLSILIWEAFGMRDWTLRRLAAVHARRVWRKFFSLSGDVFLVQSHVITADAKPATRDADVVAMDILRPHLLASSTLLRQDPGMSTTQAPSHFVVVGSTRYSSQPRDLQAWYDLRYQFIYEYLQTDPIRRILKIVSPEGHKYVATVDANERRDNIAIDYGTLFLAQVPHGKRIFWFSGIHGAGTIGISMYFTKHPEVFQVRSQEAEWSRQWLLRIEYDPSLRESKEMIRRVEVLDGPVPCTLRKVVPPVRAVICDFGNVLMAFDRDRTYRALGHAYGKPYREIEAALAKADVRRDYELGKISDLQFFENIQEVLGKNPRMEFENFAEWWGDIFWENRDVVDLFRELHSQTSLVLLSNTNQLHMANVSEHYPDLLSLFHGHIFSFKEGKLKPAAELFQRAMQVAGTDIRPEQCVYIDDVPEFVTAAEKLGMRGHVYGSYPELVRALRAFGLRLA